VETPETAKEAPKDSRASARPSQAHADVVAGTAGQLHFSFLLARQDGRSMSRRVCCCRGFAKSANWQIHASMEQQNENVGLVTEMGKNDELLSRLNNKEDSFTERKPQGANAYEFRKTIVAFANSLADNQTGLLFIGVRDDGTIAGVSGADSLQKTIRKICEMDCYPPIKLSCSVLAVGGKDVVAVEISASNQRPHFAGPAFVRVGSESKAATSEVYQELLTSHCSPAGQLLKLKNERVTVWGNQQAARQSASSIFNREHECRITAVTPTYVSLMDGRVIAQQLFRTCWEH
jgi:hypothetical protein